MRKTIHILLFFFFGYLLFSCGSSSQFAKRKFTKGVYVEKRSHPRKTKRENKKMTFFAQKSTINSSKADLLANNDEKKLNIENSQNHLLDDEFDNEIILQSNLTEEHELTEPLIKDEIEGFPEKEKNKKEKKKNGKVALWWGAILTILGIAFLSVTWFLYWPVTLSLGLVFLGAGIGLLIYGAKKMKQSKKLEEVEPKEEKPKEEKPKTAPNNHRKLVIASIVTASVALVLATLGFVIGFFTTMIVNFVFAGLAILIAIAAIVLSKKARKNKDQITKKQNAIAFASLIMGILAIVLGTIFILVGTIFL